MISKTNVEGDIEVLSSFISKYEYIVNGLQDNGAWKAAVEDKKDIAKGLDSAWAYENDSAKLFKMQVTKIATDDIINMIDRYRQQINILKEERNKLVNPETMIQKDVDNG